MDNKKWILLLPLHSRSRWNKLTTMNSPCSLELPLFLLSPKSADFRGPRLEKPYTKGIVKVYKSLQAMHHCPLGNHRFGYRVLRAKALVSSVGCRGGETHPLSPRRGR